MSIRERLDGLSRGELTGLIVVLVVTLRRRGPLVHPVAAEADPGRRVVDARPRRPAGRVRPAGRPRRRRPVIVDVAGWVRQPGVYEFAAGDRVIDAIERAGGPRKGADLTALNLAAPLVDGSQIVVPRVGTAPEARPGRRAVDHVGRNARSSTSTPRARPSWRHFRASARYWRRRSSPTGTRHGPFASVDQLEDVSGIGPSTLEEIRDFVTV